LFGGNGGLLGFMIGNPKYLGGPGGLSGPSGSKLPFLRFDGWLTKTLFTTLGISSCNSQTMFPLEFVV